MNLETLQWQQQTTQSTGAGRFNTGRLNARLPSRTGKFEADPKELRSTDS